MVVARKTRLIETVFSAGLSILVAVPMLGVEALSQSQNGESSNASLQSERNNPSLAYDAYIIGPGDTLQIELLDLPELSGVFSIGPDGTLYLPRLRALSVEGLTVEELRYFLVEQFKTYVKNPEIYIRPVGYRPVRVYVSGEVKRPGYYTLSGLQGAQSAITSSLEEVEGNIEGGNSMFGSTATVGSGTGNLNLFPTLFDAIRASQGLTPYSDLSLVEVTRKQPISAGGGKIRASLNFISLLTEGDESQNIRLFDGDSIKVSKSDKINREQLIQAGQTNISPQFLQVYVSGRVKEPGGVVLPQASALNQAISLAGGLKLMHGSIEFVRFTREGEIDRRIFNYNPNAPSDDYRNPILMAGDIIRVRDSIASASVELLNELTAPMVGIYSVYSIYRDVRY